MSTSRFRALVALCALAFGVTTTVHAAPSLEVYGKLARIENMTLSPSGDRYAFIRVSDSARQLVVVPVDGGKSTVMNFAAKDKVRAVSWAGDDHVLVTVSGTTNFGGMFTIDAFETDEVLVLPLNGKPSFVVFEGHKEIVPIVTGRYGSANVDGHWYGYFGAITLVKTMTGTVIGHGYSDLYKVDLDTGTTTFAAKGGDSLGEWLVGTDGKVIARSNYFEKTGAWQLNAGLFGDLLMSGHSLTNGPTLAGLGQTPDMVLVHTPDLPQPTYQLAALAGGDPHPVAEGERISNPLFDRRTHLWMGDVVEGDVPQVVLFAPERQARMNGARKAFAKYNVRLISYDNDFNRFIISTDGGDDSGTYWLVDIGKHSVESIGQAYPDVKETDVGPVSMVDWKAADGLELHGVLTLPPGKPARGLPVVVLPHGGPQARDYPGFDWWAQAFASRGYAVLQPNFRGSDGYGADFVNAGHGQWGRKMQTDISDGLAALAAQGIVDPKRACIVGASYGGYAALAGVTLQHGVYRCAVADAPVADLREFLHYRDTAAGYKEDATMRYWKQFMGASSNVDRGLDDVSPAKLADHADAPILLVHGKDDTVVPFEQSNEMLAALKRAGKPAEMVVMPNEDHWLSRADTRLSMLTAAVAFVQKYNPAD
jgi:dipeptidyl aminopeptidase/acylaminoacyl peptidase